jgi:hypothetical protein
MLDWAGRAAWLQNFGGKTSDKVATRMRHDNIKMDSEDLLIGFSISDVEPSSFPSGC